MTRLPAASRPSLRLLAALLTASALSSGAFAQAVQEPSPPAAAAGKAAEPAPAAVLPRATTATATLPKATAPAAALPAATPSVPAVPTPATGALIPPPGPPVAPVISAAPAPAAVSPATPDVKATAKAKQRVAPPAPPRETALSTDPHPSLTPETFFATAKASERYATIADAGGWPTIEAPLAPGSTGRGVATLRLRLAIEGDLKARRAGDEPVLADAGLSLFDTRWGSDLTAAVKRFQSRHGLRETGAVQGATLKAMNVPARVRFTELASSAQRLAGRAFDFGDRYVAVNLPSASVEAVENGEVVRRYTAIVGDPEHASPEVDARVVGVNINPTWTVPVSIIKNEIIPKMQKDAGYLARQRIRVLDNTGRPVDPASIDWNSQRATSYTLRQDSGKANSLGTIRINMPNKLAVYMHDTPGKHLFGADNRFLSHGCVRVQGVNDLAAWLLKDSLGAPDGLWSGDNIQNKIDGGEHEEIKLARPVPVAWVYMTGWANGDGVAHFRDDVYGIDTVGTGAEAKVDPRLLPPTQ